MTTLLLNGRVHSPAMPDATAMAVRDGVVAWLGSDDVGRAQFPDAQIIDLDGAFVAPAFVDSHVHLTATGLTLTGLDLRPATSLRHCLQLLGDYARAHPDGPMWGHGWDESGWPERTPPSTADVDECRRGQGRVPGPRRRPLGSRLDCAAPAGARSGRCARVLRPAAVDRRRASPGAGGRPRRARQPSSGGAPSWPPWTPRPPSASSRCTSAQARTSAASTDWDEVRGIEHGVEVVGYWGEAVSQRRTRRGS